MNGQRFANRQDAGRKLAKHLLGLGPWPDVTVLGLQRGGVALAAEVASVLHVPLDVFLVRKLGTPGHPELALGAIASGSVQGTESQTADSPANLP